MALTVRIQTKIIVSFIVGVALTAMLGAITLHNRSLLLGNLEEMEREARVLEHIAGIQLDVERLVMPANDYLITASPEEKKLYDKQYQELLRGLARLERLTGSDANLKTYEETRRELVDLNSTAMDIFSIDKPVDEAREMSMGTGARLMEELDSIASNIIVSRLGSLYATEKLKVSALIADAERSRKTANITLLVGATASAIVLIFLIIYLGKSILTPIALFKEGASIIGKGDLDHRIELNDGLEMNVLAHEFNTMAASLKDSRGNLEEKVKSRTAELEIANLKLKELSVTDGLTGMFNHKHFYDLLCLELARSERYKRKFSLAMIDIDHFKNVNDTHGHRFGDEILSIVSDLIKEHVREQDIISRYGGEEFAIILPETDKEAALLVTERLREAIHTEPVPKEETQPGGRLTVSIGMATYPEDATETNQLVEAADSALYQAKEGGRDQVVVATKAPVQMEQN